MIETEGAQQSGTGSHRFGILVAGMHRSGTSALTRTLNLLGCDLPANLIGASKSNPTGHWESEPICRFNDRLFESAGTKWDDWQPFNEGWLRSPKANELREEAVHLLGSEFGNSHLFVLKDPRFCRVLPFWRSVLNAASVRPLVISPLRNPLEVAASLERRNGFEPAFGFLLWLRHVLDAEFASRDVPRLFTSYDGLLHGWAPIALQARDAFGIEWPRMTDAVGAEIQAYLTESHRHHNQPASAVAQDPTLGGWLRDSFSILNRWAESGEDPQDFPALDRVRSEFNAATPMFGRLIATGRAAIRQVRTLKAEAAKSSEHVKAIEAANAEALQRAETAEARIASQTQELDELQSALQEAHRKADASDGQFAGQVKSLQAEIARQNLAVEVAQVALATERNIIDRLQNELDTARQQADARDGHISRLQAEIARQDLTIEAAQAAVATERERAARLDSELVNLGRQVEDKDRQIANLDSELVNQAEAAQRSDMALADMRGRLAETESALAQRRLEAEQTAEELSVARAEIGQLTSARDQDQKALAGLKEHVEFLLGNSEELQTALATAEARERDHKRASDEALSAAEKALSESHAQAAKMEQSLQSALRQAQDRAAQAEQNARERLAELESMKTQAAKAKTKYTTELANAQAQIEKANAEKQRLDNQVRERFDEIATLTRLVRGGEDQIATLTRQVRGGEDEAQRLRQTAAQELGTAVAALSSGRMVSFMPRWLKLRYNKSRVSRAGLFDPQWYRQYYKDVAEAGIDPLQHYVEHGHRESRLPNAKLAAAPAPNGEKADKSGGKN